MITLILANSSNQAFSALSESLRKNRPDWQILDALAGAQVLEFITDAHVDGIITDRVLKDVSGVDLLNTIKEQNVDIVRIVMAPDTDEDIVLESAKANHRLIYPTTSHDGIISAIETSVQLNERLNSSEIKERIGKIHALPSLPMVYQQMVNELASPQSSLMNVARIIETDMGLTATVLKTVNSAFYGLNQRIESVPQGVALLGAHLIKNITLTANVFKQFEGAQSDLEKLKQLNDQANKSGALANHLARLAKVPKSVVDHAQIAGMLGNCGELLSMSNPETEPAPSEIVSENQMQEQLLCAYMLRLWLMPDPVVEAVAMQNETPPPSHDAVSPWLILHTIRFLEKQLPDVNDADQWQQCVDYLTDLVSEELATQWLQAYRDLQLLTAHNDLDQTHAA